MAGMIVLLLVVDTCATVALSFRVAKVTRRVNGLAKARVVRQEDVEADTE